MTLELLQRLSRSRVPCLIVLSDEADASSFPFGEKTTSSTSSECPSSAVQRRIMLLVTHTLQSDTLASAAVAHHILHFPATLLRIHTAVLSAGLAKAHTAGSLGCI